MISLLARAAIQSTTTNYWWIIFNGLSASLTAGAGLGGYWLGRANADHYPPMQPESETANINLEINQVINEQLDISQSVEQILVNIENDEPEVDYENIVTAHEDFTKLLEDILSLTETYEDNSQEKLDQLVELKRIFSDDELGYFGQVEELVRQNNSLSAELDNYKCLVAQLINIVNDLRAQLDDEPTAWVRL